MFLKVKLNDGREVIIPFYFLVQMSGLKSLNEFCKITFIFEAIVTSGEELLTGKVQIIKGDLHDRF